MPNFFILYHFHHGTPLIYHHFDRTHWLAMDHEKSGQDGWKNYLNG